MEDPALPAVILREMWTSTEKSKAILTPGWPIVYIVILLDLQSPFFRTVEGTIEYTSGFWPRVRARTLRAPVFLGSLPCQTGRCAPPAHRIFAASYLPPKTFCPSSGSQGLLSFHWAKLHPTELHCILLSYAAPS
jgi:hypothetical protein